jgi:hypothetical protein
MEKQLALFKTDENDDFSIFSQLPERVQRKTETLLAKLLIKQLCMPVEEVQKDED